MHTKSLLRIVFPACLIALFSAPAFGAANLVADPSFEKTKARDQFGRVFAEWAGWKFEGECNFEVGEVPHTGETSALLICNSAGKIRLNQPRELAPGRYLITAWIRGLSIGTGAFDASTEFMFNEKYIQLHKKGTFGWIRLTYVADLDKAATTGPSFGLWGPGRLWIDDVSMERVGADVKLTEVPLLSEEQAPIAPPGPLGAGAVRCPHCAYRNMPSWKKCYACGASLSQARTEAAGPAEKLITSFEKDNPFNGGTVVAAHATDGSQSLRIDGSMVAMTSLQNWAGYDYLSFDTWTDSKDPVPVYIEIQDKETKDYWTRVNYNAVVPPGKGTLILPLKQLYVGEKGRPGRNLILSGITRLVLAATPAKPVPLFIDRVRLERDLTGPAAMFEGLSAFDFGPADSPVLDGYTAITPGTLYDSGRGYGLKNAKIWKAFNVLQPDPLYQDYICIEAGGLAVDVPNGAYRVVVNVDAASGFWGENQTYRTRSILAQGKTVVSEKQDFQSFEKKHFFFWDKDDLPTDNTFDKYNKVHFSEKTFDVNVTNGQLFVEFKGENWANSVSSLVAFPIAKAAEGARFLDYTRERRRFYFDNAFKRILHRATGDALQPTAEETRHGLVLFQRDLMKDIFYNDTPFRSETGKPLTGDAFPGQDAPLILGVVPLKDLGRVTASVGDLVSPQGTIRASAVEIGYGSYRLSRVSGDGAVYTILPRFVMPKADVELPKGVTRPFWFTVHTPAGASPGVYTGKALLTISGGEQVSIPVQFRVRKGALDAVNIPVGPFGGGIGSGWYEDDPAAAAFSGQLTAKSLRLLRARGFTMFSGVPRIVYEGFDIGKPVLDFSVADRQMKEARNLGFLAVDSYGAGISGIDPYFEDTAKMTAAGFTDYAQFIRTVYSAVQQHAREKNWLPVYWNIADEPAGDDLKRSATNAGAYRSAFPKGPPFFTGATSLMPGKDASDPNFQLAKNLTIPSLTYHDEPGLRLLRQQGTDWAFYNDASRWTYGTYLYKAATQFDLKFRIAWHWNLVAGDPYYALDSREDDTAWANSTPQGDLVPSIDFARISAGLDDYRELLTAARLGKAKAGTPAAKAAETLIAARMAAFHLGPNDHDALFGIDDWTKFRQQLSDAIEALQ
jgi:hypothetical protein